MLKRIIPLTAGLLALGCGEKNTFAPPPPAQVTVQVPLVQDQEFYLEFPGRIEATQVVEIRARVRGFLEKIAFEPGKIVAKDDLLFEIEDTPYVASQKAAVADIAKADAAVLLAQSNVDRRSKAGAGVSEIEKDQAAAELAAAKADVLAAKAALDKVENDLNYTVIKSEMAGRISESKVDLGNLVGNNEATLLTTIVRDDPMLVYFEVNERQAIQFLDRREELQIDELEPEIRLILADGSPYDELATAQFADNRLETETGTLMIRCSVPNPDGKLADGFFVRVGVPRKISQAVMVPTSSLQQDLAGYFLMTVGAGNKVVRKNVEVGPRVTVDDRQMRVVTSGIEPTDKLITIGLQRAREGALVSPIEAGDKPAAQPPSPGSPSGDAPKTAE